MKKALQTTLGSFRKTAAAILVNSLLLAPIAALGETVIVFEEDFEGDFPGAWDVTDRDGAINGEYFWDKDSYRAVSGTYSAFCAAGGTDGFPGGTANYPNNLDTRMIYGPFDLSDASAATLDFMLWMDTEENFDFFFYGADKPETLAKGTRISGNNGGWNPVSLDLGTLAMLGESQVWVEFHFNSDDSFNAEGVWIDDIVVSKEVEAVDYDLDLQEINVTSNVYGVWGRIYIPFVVQNVGTEPSPSWATTFYLSTDTDITSSDFKIGLTPIAPALEAGQAIEASFRSLTLNGIPEGEYYVGGIINLFDADETNNSNFGPNKITLSTSPDIHVYPNELTIEDGPGPGAKSTGLMSVPDRYKPVTPVHPAKVASSLAGKVARDGKVDIIVGFDVAFQPEGRLDSARVKDQRAAIRSGGDQLVASMRGLNYTEKARYRYIPFLALSVDGQALKSLSKNPLVRSIQEDRLAKPFMESSNGVIGSPLVWADGLDGTGQAVAVLDTGADITHPWFTTGVNKIVAEACFSSSNPGVVESLCPGGVDSSTDPGSAINCTGLVSCDHGTHVAGTAVGNDGSGPNYGVARGASLIPIQVFRKFLSSENCGGPAPCLRSNTSDYLLALEHVQTLAATHDIAAVNMSLGGGRYVDQANCDAANPSTKAQINNLASLGIATVIATGNDSWTDSMGEPGCISSAISVGATTDGDLVSSFSNIADFIDLLAPGVAIQSAIPGGGVGTKQGTSMATPHVAGAWAVLKQQNPDASVVEILNALQTTGVEVDDHRLGGSVAGMKRIALGPALELLGHKPRNFAIINKGFSDLNITSIAPVQEAPWLSFSPPAPFILEPEDTQIIEIVVDFETAPPGTTVLDIEIQSNDPDENPWPGHVSLTVISSKDPPGPNLIMMDGFEETDHSPP